MAYARDVNRHIWYYFHSSIPGTGIIMSDLLNELARVLKDRKTANPDNSYVASLYAGGTDAVLRKIGEEATEVVLAAKTGEKEAIIHEIADLWFHSLVLLASLDLRPDDILEELNRRFGRSGLDEKASRGGPGLP